MPRYQVFSENGERLPDVTAADLGAAVAAVEADPGTYPPGGPASITRPDRRRTAQGLTVREGR